MIDYRLIRKIFKKRNHVKNFVPIYERFCAKRAKDEERMAANIVEPHMKGTSHGIMDNQTETKVTTQKVEVWAEDIQGIVYYIDKFNNVYDTADIIKNQMNPKIIAKYVKNEEIYSIPEFNI